MGDITTAMAGEILAAHKEASALIKEANAAIKEAVKAAGYAGTLISKAQRSKKSTVYQWLAEEGVPGDEARAYVLAESTARKRDAASDRRCLLKLRVLDPQIKATTAAPKVKRPVSLATKIQRAERAILGHVEKERSVDDMDAAARAITAKQLEPLAKLYLSLAR